MKSWLLVPALGLSCAFAAASAQTYTIQDLGVVPDFAYGGTFPNAINESGDVTGSAVSYFVSAPGVPVGEAFLYRDGKIAALSGYYSYGYGITGDTREDPWHRDDETRKLRVVGSAEPGGAPGPGEAFLYEDHLLRNLGLLPGGSYSEADAVNSFGEIAGSADTAEGVEEAVLFRNGNIISLGTLPTGISTSVTGINNKGDVIGNVLLANFQTRPFLYHNGKMINLGTFAGATYVRAAGINDSGQIAGTATSVNFQFEHAFVWSNGKFHDLGLFPEGVSTQANAINASGEVVGQAVSDTSTGQNFFAFLWSNGKLRALTDLLPPNSSWILTTATGINSRGQIVGWGYPSAGGGSGGFIMSPDCRDQKNRDCGFCREGR